MGGISKSRCNMKSVAAVLLALLYAVTLALSGIYAHAAVLRSAVSALYSDSPDVSAESYCVVDAKTGEVVLAKNADKEMHPASITKIMTLLVVVEQCQNLDAEITASEEALTNLEPRSSTLDPMPRPYETFTVRDVLYGLIMRSGNECANMLAEYISGDNERFAKLMNERATQAGALNTHFSNPHGLDEEDHLTTAYDMALIMQAALENDTAREILSAKTYTIPATEYASERNLESGHSMINGTVICEGVFAGKSGYTRLAQSTLVTAAERNSTQLIAVVMKSDQGNHYNDTKVLLDYAYDLLDGKTPVSELNVYDAQVSKVTEIGFEVSWKVSDSAVRAEFPVWLENDETDVMTRNSVDITGDTITCSVSITDHDFKTGIYTAQAYVYDKDGNYLTNTVKVLVGASDYVPGIMQYNGATYYVKDNYSLGLLWQELEDGNYYFDYMTGIMKTGWLESGSDAYYFDSDGKLHTGWLNWNGNTYYFDITGRRVVGDIILNNAYCHFDSNGALTKVIPMLNIED